MGQLLWTFDNGAEFQSDRAGFRLLAGRAPAGNGFQYMIRAKGDAAPLASGSRDSLREAIEAAEQALEAIGSPPA